MNQETASVIIEHYVRICQELNLMTEAIGGLPDAEEQKALRLPIGKVMTNLYVDLIIPLIGRYPDLDPDRKQS